MTDQRLGENILVLGSGNFGTCLAQHLADRGYDVTMWSRSRDVVDAINASRTNPKYLSSFKLSPRLTATTKIDENLLQKTSVVVQAVPTQGMRSALEKVADGWRDQLLLVCAAKGIEVGTHRMPCEIIKETLGEQAAENAVFLSGPSFAVEIMERQPTCVTVASLSEKRAAHAQSLFHAAHFRAYTSGDPVGIEIAGAMKNVVAIAAGAAQGIGFQANSRAALITRGLAEITRVGTRLGANPLTFKGLSGVGDLFLTCTSEKSRNFTVGYRLGKGEALEDVIATVGSVAEGVATTKAARQLTEDLGVDAPITAEVYKVLYESKPIAQAVMDLLTREAKPELG